MNILIIIWGIATIIKSNKLRKTRELNKYINKDRSFILKYNDILDEKEYINLSHKRDFSQGIMFVILGTLGILNNALGISYSIMIIELVIVLGVGLGLATYYEKKIKPLIK